MTTARPVQTSFIEGMDRPVGKILPSVFTGSNADLMMAIAPFYLSGSVLDVTYGEGKWWTRFTPEPFAFHDLYKVDGVDFTALPEGDSSVDTVCFDPPYVLSGGPGTSDIQDRFGIGHKNGLRGWPMLVDLISAGLDEAIRVSRCFVLVKCMEFVQGADILRDPPTMVTNRATEKGAVLYDRIVHHTGTGPGGHNIWTAKRARRAHSYLLVFKVPA